MFALFLVRNSVPLVDRCWFEYDLLRRRPSGCFFGSWCSSLFSLCWACSCVSCVFWDFFNNLVWFLRSSICLCLSADVCFVVEGTIVGNFPRRCCVWAGFSNRSFFNKNGGSSWMFVLLVFLKCWTFLSMLLVLPFRGFAWDFFKFLNYTNWLLLHVTNLVK